jgi:hypothetical protein
MAGYQFDPILTVEARSNLFLEVMTQRLRLTDPMVFNLIQRLLREMLDILSKKHIHYADLRQALVPSTNRYERGLVFDYTKFASPLYGQDVIHTLLPHLDRRSTHSVLCGDRLHRGIFGEWLAISPGAHGTVNGDSPNLSQQTLYFAYLNNLSDFGARAIDAAFQSHPAYLGSLDLDRASPVKGYLSLCLVRDFIQHRNLIIRAHEDDRDTAEDFNLSLFDFERFGFTVRSLPSIYYGVLLSYKIERLTLPQELDQRFALNALSPAPRLLDDFEVILEAPKLEYLRKEKSGSLMRAGFSSLNAADIAAQIRAKVDSSYIYNLARSTNGHTLKFNVLVESEAGARAQCALEYRPADRTLRVITFF